MPVDREQFAERFAAAAARARSFAQTMLLEPLPEPLRFRVALNESYDGNPLDPDERVFPNDSGIERSLALLRCSAEQVIELLWRDGLVPEWVNLSVCTTLPAATLIEVRCCGRFTANAELLYHQREGYPPFHVLGPDLPFDYDLQRDFGTKFSVFERAECCTLDELAALEAHADQPWSLDLFGPVFTDEALGQIPRMPRLELLECIGSPLRGNGLTRLAGQPRLRLLRLRLHEVDRFSLPDLRPLAAVCRVELYNLPEGAWAGPRFAEDARRVRELWLDGRHALVLPKEWPRSLRELRIVGQRIEAGTIPSRLDGLTLHLPHQDPDGLERLLAPLRAVDHLDLSSTLLNDTTLEGLLERVSPRRLRVVDTRVSDAYLRELGRRRPELRLAPKPS